MLFSLPLHPLQLTSGEQKVTGSYQQRCQKTGSHHLKIELGNVGPIEPLGDSGNDKNAQKDEKENCAKQRGHIIVCEPQHHINDALDEKELEYFYAHWFFVQICYFFCIDAAFRAG
jgi:hypothetical protein